MRKRQGLKGRLAGGLTMLLERQGKAIVPRERLYDWQFDLVLGDAAYHRVASEEAREYLQADNPKLIDLERRYAKCDSDVTTPLVWTAGHVTAQDLIYFRGDNAYVWQDHRGGGIKWNRNIIGYALATYYVLSIDRHDLLEKLTEDDAFGSIIFDIAGHKISRDLLDSILEIDFLDRHLGLLNRRDVTMLDIGAGYGRLAYRISTSVSGLREYLCADAVAHSTFISEFYLRYRKAKKTRVVPLDEIDQMVATNKIDIALNIASFSECRMDAIEWWVSRLSRSNVRYFMIVPNETKAIGGQTQTNRLRMQTNDRNDFSTILEKHGYSLLICEPKYHDPIIQQYAVEPVYYFLFELR